MGDEQVTVDGCDEVVEVVLDDVTDRTLDDGVLTWFNAEERCVIDPYRRGNRHGVSTDHVPKELSLSFEVTDAIVDLTVTYKDILVPFHTEQ